MKRTIILILILSLLLTGCSWMDGEYHSVTPHMSGNHKTAKDAVTVTGYNELRDALVELVTDGRQKSTIYTAGIDTDLLDQYMGTAIMHVFQNCAVGAFAADKIEYEYGISGGKTAVVIEVSYLHTRQEILRIKNAEDMEGVKSSIAAALRKCDASAVIKVANYEEIDLIQYVEDYVSNYPDVCMETPVVKTAVYPNRGDERVVEMIFTYQNSREQLRNMQDTVKPIFDSAKMYVQTSEEPLQKYEQLYSFLMERFDYKLETSINPAYSLLRYGVGDCKAFAQVYANMCRNAELECLVVTGTRDGEPWYWNLVRIGEEDYHVDLLTCVSNGEFTLMTPQDMENYVWDYLEYE